MQTLHEPETTVALLPVTSLGQQEAHTQAEERRPLPNTRRKRIVSKGQFAVNLGRKAALSSSGASLYGMGLLGLAISLTVVALLDTYILHDITALSILGVLVLASMGCFYVGRRTIKKAVRLDAGIPLTHANTADLPATDSLVRASQEPVQSQEGVLLRAASGEAWSGQEGQLLRASVGRKE